MTKTEAMYRIIGQGPPPPPPTAQTAQLTVSSSPISGVMATISQDLEPIDSGQTPKTFVLTVGQAYLLGVADAGTDIFDRWSDGDTSREKIIIPLTTSPISHTAIFRSIGPPPPPPSTGIPATPTGLIVSPTAERTTALITWDPVSGATGYILHRSSSIFPSGGVTDIPVSAPPFPNTGLVGGTAGNTYTYRISAVNSFGQSAQSGPVTIFIPPATGLPPPPPGTGAFPITDVILNYWHHIQVGAAKSVFAEMAYTASAVVPTIRAAMSVEDTTGALIVRHTRDVAGALSGKVGMYVTIPPGSPSNLVLKFRFYDAAAETTMMSAIRSQAADLNTFSNSNLPLSTDPPTETNNMRVRVIWIQYTELPSGLWEVVTVATYRTWPAYVGTLIRGTLRLRVPGAAVHCLSTQYSAGVPADATGVIVMYHAEASLGAGFGTCAGTPNPIDVRTFISENGTGLLKSNVVINEIPKGAMWIP